MKQTLRNLFVFSSFGLTCLAASGGCSSDPSSPIGAGATTTTGATAAGGSSAGTFTTPTSGSSTGGAGGSGTAGTTVMPTAGTFGTAGTGGTFAAGGTFGSSGTDTGGVATAGGGAGGAAAGTTSAGTGGTAAGTGGTGGGATDFPANCPAPTGTHGTALTKTCWKASATDCSNSAATPALKNPPSNAIDADAVSRFSTGSKMVTGTMFKVEIDMGKAVMINGVSSSTPAPAAAGAASDIPPFIEIDVSTDGTTWKPVACGTNALMADISFAAVSARYVRFAEHGTSDAWWSITDINVYGASAADVTCGADPGTPACTSIGMTDVATCCGAVHTL